MKVLIVGSLSLLVNEVEKETFKKICIRIGKSLAENNFTIVLGSSNPKTADKYVFEGIENSQKNCKVIVYRGKHDDSNKPFFEEKKKSTNINIIYRATKSKLLNAGRVDIISVVDIVLIIGGKNGSAIVGYSSPYLFKPVLALPIKGTTSQELWDLYYYKYEFAKIQKTDLELLKNIDNDEYGDLVIKTLKILKKNNPFKHESIILNILSILLLLFIITIWLGLINVKILSPSIDNDYLSLTIFVVLILSSLIGSILRINIELLKNETRFSGSKICKEMSISIILGLTLTLFYWRISF